MRRTQYLSGRNQLGNESLLNEVSMECYDRHVACAEIIAPKSSPKRFEELYIIVSYGKQTLMKFYCDKI